MNGVHRGDVWDVEFEEPVGRRPAVVLTRESIIPALSAVTVVEVTRTVRDLPTEVELDPADGVEAGSVVNCNNVFTVPKDMLARRRGSVDFPRLVEIGKAVAFALDL